MSFEAPSFETVREEGRLRVFAQIDGVRSRIANFEDTGRDAKELRADLQAATKKPIRTVIGGKAYVLHGRVAGGGGEDAFEVSIVRPPKRDRFATPQFTPKQGQYLAFIHHYTKVHRCAPAASDLQYYFRVSPPSVHDMLKTQQRNGLIEKTPGQARSIRLLVAAEFLPPLR